jgi:hypothetical protein
MLHDLIKDGGKEESERCVGDGAASDDGEEVADGATGDWRPASLLLDVQLQSWKTVR